MSNVQRCSGCGQENTGDAVFCVGCGQRLTEEIGPAPRSTVPPDDIDGHLMWSVFAAVVGLLCFAVLPAIPAAVAVVHAIRVGDRVTAGDLEAARQSSREAEKWLKWAGRLLPVGFVIMFVFVITRLF